VVGHLDGMDPPLFPSGLVSLLNVFDFPGGHDRPVVGLVPFGEFRGKESEIVLAHDLVGLNPQIQRVVGVAGKVGQVPVFEENALRKVLDQTAVEYFALQQLLLRPLLRLFLFKAIDRVRMRGLLPLP